MSRLEFIISTTNSLSTTANAIKDEQPSLAQRLIDIVSTSTNPISDGYWNRIEPHYGSPAYLIAVKDLNERILAGKQVVDFQDYVACLVALINNRVAA